jgi:hypothetical protein
MIRQLADHQPCLLQAGENGIQINYGVIPACIGQACDP